FINLTWALCSAGLGPCQSALHFTSALAASSPLPIESQNGEMPLVMTLKVGAPGAAPPPPDVAVLLPPPAAVPPPPVSLSGFWPQPIRASAEARTANPPKREKRVLMDNKLPAMVGYCLTLTQRSRAFAARREISRKRARFPPPQRIGKWEMKQCR